MRALGLFALPLLCSLLPYSAAWGAKPAKAPELPPPSASFAVASEPDQWTLHVENTGETPFLLLADARLIRIEFAAEGKKKPVVCSLPDSVRNEVGLDRQIVIEPHGSYTEKFDPYFICFGETLEAAFNAAQQATVHFGYAPKKGTGGSHVLSPYVTTSVAAATSSVAELVAPVEIHSHRAASASAQSPVATAEPGPYDVRLPTHEDAERGFEISTTVTATNHGPLQSWIYLRPSTIGFTVTPTSGAPVDCPPSSLGGAPIRESFTSLIPRATTSLSVSLTALCPKGAFAKAGIYRVSPRLDTTLAPGSSLGLFAFVGRAAGLPMTLRVRHSTRQIPVKPKVDSAPPTPPKSEAAEKPAAPETKPE